LSFEIHHPKNNVHNQDGNHDDNQVRITFFFFELTDNDGQNFLAGIVRFVTALSAITRLVSLVILTLTELHENALPHFVQS
jgi:hypothetical protein